MNSINEDKKNGTPLNPPVYILANMTLPMELLNNGKYITMNNHLEIHYTLIDSDSVLNRKYDANDASMRLNQFITTTMNSKPNMMNSIHKIDQEQHDKQEQNEDLSSISKVALFLKPRKVRKLSKNTTFKYGYG